MNRTTIALTTAAAVVILGGAAAGGYALTSAPEPTETPAAVSTATPTPDVSPEATPTVEPTPDESATPTSTPTPTPEKTEPPAEAGPTYTGKEGEFVTWAGEHVRGYGLNITDAELLAYGYSVCDQIREAGMASPGMIFIPELTASVNAGFGSIAITVLCPEFA